MLPTFIYVHKKHNLYGVLIKALNNSESNLIRMIKRSTRLDSYPYTAFKSVILENNEFKKMVREWKESFNNKVHNSVYS